MKLNFLLIPFTLIIFVGCTTPRLATKVSGLCYDLPVEIVEKRIHNFMDSCLTSIDVGDKVLKFTVGKYDIPNGVRLFLNDSNGKSTGWYLADLVIDSQSCRSKVTFRGAFGKLRNSFELTNKAILSGTPKCS